MNATLASRKEALVSQIMRTDDIKVIEALQEAMSLITASGYKRQACAYTQEEVKARVTSFEAEVKAGTFKGVPMEEVERLSLEWV